MNLLPIVNVTRTSLAWNMFRLNKSSRRYAYITLYSAISLHCMGYTGGSNCKWCLSAAWASRAFTLTCKWGRLPENVRGFFFHLISPKLLLAPTGFNLYLSRNASLMFVYYICMIMFYNVILCILWRHIRPQWSKHVQIKGGSLDTQRRFARSVSTCISNHDTVLLL